eukprot:2315302-Pyramimonas_sp.AAC.1
MNWRGVVDDPRCAVCHLHLINLNALLKESGEPIEQGGVIARRRAPLLVASPTLPAKVPVTTFDAQGNAQLRK